MFHALVNDGLSCLEILVEIFASFCQRTHRDKKNLQQEERIQEFERPWLSKQHYKNLCGKVLNDPGYAF